MYHHLRSRPLQGRRDAIVLGLIALAVVAALMPGLAAGARSSDAARSKGPERLGEFLWGLAGQESGWSWTARNTSSGAYGRYQIMPVNWPFWADDYVSDRWAEQTPHNQELVARGKITDLYAWLGGWRRVAYWWLTGDTETNEKRWSDLASGYVDNVTTLMKRAPDGGDPIPPDTSGERPPAERGDWRSIVDGATLFDALDGGDQVGRVRDGQIVFVQGARWNDRDVLWMRVSTAGDDVGWLSIRRTVPTRRPDDAERWPKDRVTDTGPDDARRRERARPRPR